MRAFLGALYRAGKSVKTNALDLTLHTAFRTTFEKGKTMEILKLNSISLLANETLADYDVTDNAKSPVGILVRSFKMDEYALPESVVAIARAGAGVNNIPHAEYAKKGVAVFNTPGANANAVKELVIAALIIGARNIVEATSWAATLKGDDVAKQVEKGKSAFAGNEIEGKSVCIVGLGAIGRKVAQSAHALGMNVTGYDPFISEQAKSEIPFVTIFDDLKHAWRYSDFVTLHVPMTPDNKGFIDDDAINSMKNGVILINCARGELVNVTDVKSALENGKLRKYVVDFPSEECLNVKGIIAIPHLGASTQEAEDNCAVMAAAELKDYIENGNTRNSVNMPNLSVPKSAKHRYTVISTDNGENPFGGVSATRNGIRYTIVDTDEVPDLSAISDENVIKARLIY